MRLTSASEEAAWATPPPGPRAPAKRACGRCASSGPRAPAGRRR